MTMMMIGKVGCHMAFAWMFTSAIAMTIISDPKVDTICFFAMVVTISSCKTSEKVENILYQGLEPAALYYWEVTSYLSQSSSQS